RAGVDGGALRPPGELHVRLPPRAGSPHAPAASRATPARRVRLLGRRDRGGARPERGQREDDPSPRAPRHGAVRRAPATADARPAGADPPRDRRPDGSAPGRRRPAGGPPPPAAARVVGRERVAHLYRRLSELGSFRARLTVRMLNGLPGLVIDFGLVKRGYPPRGTIRFDLDEHGLVQRVHSVLATRKLSAVRVARGADAKPRGASGAEPGPPSGSAGSHSE